MGFLGCLLQFADEPLMLLPVLRRRELMLGGLGGRHKRVLLCELMNVNAWASGQE